jgi:hypothetical protein
MAKPSLTLYLILPKFPSEKRKNPQNMLFILYYVRKGGEYSSREKICQNYDKNLRKFKRKNKCFQRVIFDVFSRY